jgi:hypothetical protein
MTTYSGWRRAVTTAVALALGVAMAATNAPAQSEVSPQAPAIWDTDQGNALIDDFSSIAAWTPAPADGVKLDLVADEGALRLDFAFSGGGWAIARRDVNLPLPENYALTYRLRGQSGPQHLELKLIDETGQNVYWHVRRDMPIPTEWTDLRTKKRQVSFAWGPDGSDKPLRRIKTIEIAVTAGSGGAGSVWLDDLRLVALPVSSGPVPVPVAEASSQVDDKSPDLALDGDATTWWLAGREETATTFTLDFGGEQEFGGLTVDWLSGACPREYLVELDSGDGRWRPALHVPGSNGGRDQLYMPESEATRLRLVALVKGELPPAISELKVEPLAWSQTKEAFMGNLAREARRGLYPRGFLGEPTAWTVVGRDFDTREGLIGTDGALEAGPGMFSVEPFLWSDGKLVTWNDVKATQTLEGGFLPIPRVTWNHRNESGANWQVTLTAAGAGPAEASYILARYRVQNLGDRPDTLRLYLALRPMQVNPPVQFLNIRGGTAKVRQLEREGDVLVVDGRPAVQLLTTPDGWGASAFFGGDIVADWLEQGRVPAAQAVGDPMDAASGAAWWDVVVDSGKSRDIAVALPLHSAPAPAKLDVNKELKDITRAWHRKLDKLPLKAPKGLSRERKALAEEAIATAKAQVGWILVNRAGPAIQPGTRSYARSWIRDGALTGEALLRMGLVLEAREFLEWFAPHQYENGKIPCVVDARGADPVPEHDSTGEFIYLVAQVWRHTHDRELLAAMWPRVQHGVAYLDSLLDTRRTPEYMTPEMRHFYGILPPSISHEGYSAKPMHSYWDDFFCLRGFKDAAWLAGEAAAAGLDVPSGEVARLAAIRDRFAADFAASIAASMKVHGVSYVPGCADLGDFDATSTTIALDPCEAADLLPPGALEATFEKYWTFFADRRGGAPWDAFTPYEVRCIGAVAALGWDDRAWEMVDWFLSQRAVPGWKVWGEVVGSDPVNARFIGDMPHGWVGSDFVRALSVCMRTPPKR